MNEFEIMKFLEDIYKKNYDEFERMYKGYEGKLYKKMAKLFLNTHNKYGVPYRGFELKLGKIIGNFKDEDWGVGKDRTIEIDIGIEEDWGNIQPCCDKGKEYIGYGNEADGYRIIKGVKSLRDDTSWDVHTTEGVSLWANSVVFPWVDWYSC